MNILIKLTCLVGLVIAPILGDGHIAQAHQLKEEQKKFVPKYQAPLRVKRLLQSQQSQPKTAKPQKPFKRLLGVKK